MNPFNPCSFHLLRVFFSNTDLSDITDNIRVGTVFQTALLLFLLVIPRLRPGLLSLRSVLASSQTLLVVGWLLHKTYYHKTLFFICFFILIFYCSKQLNNNIKHWYFILPYKRSIRVNPINPCSKKNSEEVKRTRIVGGWNGYYQMVVMSSRQMNYMTG